MKGPADKREAQRFGFSFSSSDTPTQTQNPQVAISTNKNAQKKIEDLSTSIIQEDPKSNSFLFDDKEQSQEIKNAVTSIAGNFKTNFDPTKSLEKVG